MTEKPMSLIQDLEKWLADSEKPLETLPLGAIVARTQFAAYIESIKKFKAMLAKAAASLETKLNTINLKEYEADRDYAGVDGFGNRLTYGTWYTGRVLNAYKKWVREVFGVGGGEELTPEKPMNLLEKLKQMRNAVGDEDVPENYMWGYRRAIDEIKPLLAKAAGSYPNHCPYWRLNVDLNIYGGLVLCSNCCFRKNCAIPEYKEKVFGGGGE